jgi:hypothetical protein
VTWAGIESVGANHLSTSDLRETKLAFMILSSISSRQVVVVKSVIEVLDKRSKGEISED